MLGVLGFVCALAVSFGIGVLATVGLLVGDGFRALESVVETLAGRNVNEGVAAFNEPGSIFTSFPLRECAVIFVLAGVATVVGLRRRDPWPAVWFAAAGVAAIMAAARGLGEIRYFAMPYVLSIPPALWLLRRGTHRPAPVLAWVVVALVVAPTFLHSGGEAQRASRDEAVAAAAGHLADRLLAPGQAAIVPDQFQSPDDRWYSLVGIYSALQPVRPYRLIDDVATELSVVQQRRLRLRYFIGPVASIKAVTTLHLAFGDYRARPVPGSLDPATGIGALELLSGPET